MFIFARRGIPLKEIFEAADKGQSSAYWTVGFLVFFLLIIIGSAVWRTLKALRAPFRFMSLIYAVIDICTIGFVGTLLYQIVIRLAHAPG
jgi:hypothetical protein